MKTLNKSLLAAAVIGVVSLPGLVSAATFQYNAGKQLTFARDLIVNDGISIWVPDNLRLAAVATDVANGLDTVKKDERIKVKITLDNGAKFSNSGSGAVAATVVKSFVEGTQTGGTGVALGTIPAQAAVIDATAQYTSGGSELIFEYLATSDGVIGGAGAYFLEVNSFQIGNLVQSLGGGNGVVRAEITVQNKDNQAILAGSTVVARSQWGLEVAPLEQPSAEERKRIDVASVPEAKTRFSPNGVVGNSTGADSEYFNVGGFTLSVAKAALTGGVVTDYVNNFDARLANPHYNLVNNSTVTVTVAGSDLTPFATNQVWLDRSATCTHNLGASLNAASVAADLVTFSAPTSSGLWSANGVSDASPSDSNIYVCFGAPTENAMVAQGLSGQVRVNYNIPTQRVNPDPWGFDLEPLQYNGATTYFQNVNPAGNTTAESFLRLTNHNAIDCPVTIDAKDDDGRYSGRVSLTVAPHASEQLNVNVLESGNDPRFAANGGFRNGAGKWYVRVTAECDNFTSSALNRNSTTGVVTDLTPQRDEHGLQWSHNPGRQVP